jgi:hypothetical protein
MGSQLVSKHLVGILLSVYVRQELMEHVKDVQVDTVGVGILGVGGNKGGVGVRFQLFDSCISVVCSHLAAHQHNVSGRNSDQITIARKLAFHTGGAPDRTVRLLESDAVFWFGDLNYRIDVPIEQAYERIACTYLACNSVFKSVNASQLGNSMYVG